ncbi:MAG: flagellar protein FlgN [Clostridiaceae bacterium]|jgi:flagellar biosynthesis/type III secretory pathway chaperone|nr:flagellar protein FlgN [Clostridiaceae bacterium]
MNSEKINDLMDILEQETEIYEELLKLSKGKTDIIAKGKITELDAITKKEHVLVLKMGKLEVFREKIVNDLSLGLRRNPDDLTISELIQYLDKKQAQRFAECKTKLLNTINEIKTLNELNSKLIHNSLDFINFSMNVLSSVPEESNNYGNTGHANEGKKKTYFDVKL